MDNNMFLSDAEADVFNNLMPGNQNIRVGSKLQQALFGLTPIGKKFYIDPVNGNDSNDGLSYATAVKSFPVGYALLTANKNETLYIVGGASALNLAVTFSWEKSYTHLVGLCAGGAYGRARIGHNANFTTLFTVKANGCLFKNIHWQQGRGSSTNINCLWVDETANYNTFINCHFDSPLNATEGAQAYRVLVLGGTASTPIGARSNKFIECTFGDWTAAPSASTGALIDFKGVNAGTLFDRCTLIVNTDKAGLVAIKAAVDIGGGNPPGYVHFKECSFLALSTGVSVLLTAPTVGKIILDQCRAAGVSAWSGSSNNVLITNSYLGDDSAGLGVVQG